MNGDLAKHINIDPNLKTRILAGITGLWLNEQINATYSGPPKFIILSQSTSKFNGAGLRLGLDTNYNLNHQFSIVGLFASSLLLGTQQTTLNFKGISDVLMAAGIPLNYQSLVHPNFSQIVPGMDGKLGIKFVRSVSEKYLLSIEAGYMGAIYINAVQNYLPSNYADNSPGLDSGAIFLKSITRTVQDFSLSGPYVTASLKV